MPSADGGAQIGAEGGIKTTFPAGASERPGMRQLLTTALCIFLLCGTASAQEGGRAGDGKEDRLDIPEIAAMPAGSWLPFGRPWRDVDPGRGDNCGVDFGSLLGAWNGVLWDGRYAWVWAAGGHGDGCFNGIVRYDLQAGKPEMVVPHLALNVPLCRSFVKAGGTKDCFWEPYVSDKPYPGGMDQRIDSWDGAFLRPRSSHTYNNMVKLGDWFYLVTGHIYGSSKPDAQVWRFNLRADDIAQTIERLPDRFASEAGPDRDDDGEPDGKMVGNYAVNWITRPGKPPLLFSGAIVCQPDFQAGRYDCTARSGAAFSGAATLAWDERLQGIWAVDANHNRLTFLREIDGAWQEDKALTVTDPALNKETLGSAGLCLVPNGQGTSPVIWGQDGALIRWDGETLSTIDAPGGPGPAQRRILNKWTWNEDLGVCLGTWTVDEGFWAYKPDFSGAVQRAAANTPPADTPTAKAPAPAAPSGPPAAPVAKAAAPVGLPPAPALNPALKDNPLQPKETGKRQAKAGNRQENAARQQGQAAAAEEAADEQTAGERKKKAKPAGPPLSTYWPDPDHYPTFAGHQVRPEPWTPAAWNEPIERQPEAPDYEALCPGPWTVLDYRTEADLAGSAAQTRSLSPGTANVRIYLHPREDAEAPYESNLVLDRVQCGEVIGVPAGGRRPALTEDIGLPKTGTGFIVRGIDFLGGNVGWACHQPSESCPAFVVLQDNRIGGAGLMGDSDPSLPSTYLELRGNVMGPNLDWHGLYLERSIGKLVALSNVFFASGNAGHALKNLANYSRIEGNVLSNVGIDGQPLTRNGREVIGLFALDHYACTDSIVRNNKVVFRTSGNVATLLTLRGRNAWGNCDKGRRVPGSFAEGSRELFPPENPEYQDPARWAEIATAVQDFEAGYEKAKANPLLFTHLIEDNTFFVFEGKTGVTPRSITVHSMRPIADNPREADLKDQMAALIELCGDKPDDAAYEACWFASASPEVRYVHDHIDPARRFVMVHGNGNGRVEVPNSLPMRAPDAWAERTAVYWDPDQTYVACNADGSQCAERGPYPIDADPQPWDAVEVASPPRLINLK